VAKPDLDIEIQVIRSGQLTTEYGGLKKLTIDRCGNNFDLPERSR
jgi:hypothetical protein